RICPGREVSVIQGRPLSAPGERGRGVPAALAWSLRRAARDARPPPRSRRRRLLEPRPRGARRPGGHLRPAPTCAVAAGLYRHFVGPDARATASAPALPVPLPPA